MKFSLVLLAAMVVSVFFYYAFDNASIRALETYFETSAYIDEACDRSAEKLQKYVSRNNISSDDTEGLNIWSNKHKLVYYSVVMDGYVTYSSYYADTEIKQDEAVSTESEPAYSMDTFYGDSTRQYDIEFADGMGKVYLFGLFDYQFYVVANYVSLGVSALLFLVIFLVFLQRKLKYVRQLEDEVKILEGGGMDKEITVKGSDELSELANGLNQMRVSLKESMREKEELMEVNNSLVTGMAHDLRTPLTSLLLYTELLAKGKYKDEAEMHQYLNKTAVKANQIKSMSDQLFERFYITGKDEAALEAPQKVRSVFEGRLSDFLMFMESQRFEVECTTDWPEKKLTVSGGFIDRILDNIASNLRKYADSGEKLMISLRFEDSSERPGYVTLNIRNRIKHNPDGVESTQVGVENIRQMMSKMRGECVVTEDGEYYEMRLLFPVV